MKTIIIQGSARSNGNTNQIAKILQKHLECDLLDLKTKDISAYDYEHNNANDDFLPTIRAIINYDLILFLTPVYWYTMSGIMKDFFDRISDCLTIDKTTGRKLKGMHMAAVACGSDDTETEGFFIPFEYSADYLGMTYLGSLHTWIADKEPTEEVLNKLQQFSLKLQQAQ